MPTVIELKELCRQRGLTGYSKLRKAELEALLMGGASRPTAVHVPVVPTAFTPAVYLDDSSPALDPEELAMAINEMIGDHCPINSRILLCEGVTTVIVTNFLDALELKSPSERYHNALGAISGLDPKKYSVGELEKLIYDLPGFKLRLAEILPKPISRPVRKPSPQPAGKSPVRKASPKPASKTPIGRSSPKSAASGAKILVYNKTANEYVIDTLSTIKQELNVEVIGSEKLVRCRECNSTQRKGCGCANWRWLTTDELTTIRTDDPNFTNLYNYIQYKEGGNLLEL